jgi:hypothetical protein
VSNSRFCRAVHPSDAVRRLAPQALGLVTWIRSGVWPMFQFASEALFNGKIASRLRAHPGATASRCGPIGQLRKLK